MTVDEVADEWGVIRVYCSWFDGKKMCRDHFPATSLVKV
jgi:uncharacterized protein YodC (DUF2158 family)